MAIIRLGRFVPKTLRDWDRVFESLNLIGTPGEVEVTNPGGDEPVTIALANSGTVGVYAKVQTDAKGRVVGGASSLAESDIPASIARDSEVAASIAAHRAETDPHPDLIDDLTAVTAVALTDKVLVSQSGANKAATVQQVRDIVFGDDWDDLRMPSQAIDPAGSTAPPGRSNTTGMLEFSGTTDNIISGVAQLPHAWKKGSTIRPHLHVMFPTSTATNTRWKFEYNRGSPGGDFDNAYGTYTTLSTITIANPQSVKKHVLGAFGDLSMTGFLESSCILWRISRLASSDAADNFTAVTVLLEFDIHYQIDKAGTDAEIPT